MFVGPGEFKVESSSGLSFVIAGHRHSFARQGAEKKPNSEMDKKGAD